MVYVGSPLLSGTMFSLEEQSKILLAEARTLQDDMKSFCHTSDDPVAQDIRHRLEVLDAADTILPDMKSFCRTSDDPVAQSITARLAVLVSAQETWEAELAELDLMYQEYQDMKNKPMPKPDEASRSYVYGSMK